MRIHYNSNTRAFMGTSDDYTAFSGADFVTVANNSNTAIAISAGEIPTIHEDFSVTTALPAAAPADVAKAAIGAAQTKEEQQAAVIAYIIKREGFTPL